MGCLKATGRDLPFNFVEMKVIGFLPDLITYSSAIN
jgi:hypothetical protein